MTDFQFDQPRQLGRTGLMVGRLGLAASYGATAPAFEQAFERGANFFYWGSVRRAGMGAAIRQLAGRHRERMVVMLESYSRGGWLLARNVESGLRRLKLEYADLLLLGWHNHPPGPTLLEAAVRLQQRGRVRHLALSAHHRPVFADLAGETRLAAWMVRYNAAHRDADRLVFPLLATGGANRPGVITYTATRWRTLLDPRHTPPGLRTPTATDCYRFVLSNPDVDVCLTGPANAAELEANLQALELGPFSAEEMNWMQTVGDHVLRATAHRSVNPFMEREA